MKLQFTTKKAKWFNKLKEIQMKDTFNCIFDYRLLEEEKRYKLPLCLERSCIMISSKNTPSKDEITAAIQKEWERRGTTSKFVIYQLFTPEKLY